MNRDEQEHNENVLHCLQKQAFWHSIHNQRPVVDLTLNVHNIEEYDRETYASLSVKFKWLRKNKQGDISLLAGY